MPLQKLQEETTSTEFLEWIEYMDLEVEAFHREDYYWAQIAAEVRRGHVKKPEDVKVQDLLLDFTPKEPVKQMTPEEKMNQQKALWGQALGMGPPK